MIVFIYPGSDLGGAETLLFRISKFLKEDLGREVCFVLPREGELTKILKKNFIDYKIFEDGCFNYSGYQKLNAKLEVEFGNSALYFVVIPKILRMLWMDKIKRHRILYYCVHPRAFVSDKKYRLLIKMFDKYILKYLKNKNKLIFMDYETKNETMDYLKINFDAPIIPLPIDIMKRKKTYNRKIFEVTTISRLEFPFKSYVFGLIDDFDDLCKERHDLILNIIGYGEGQAELELYLKSKKACMDNKIRFINGIKYEEISSFLDNTCMFVGMGTTTIEAASKGIPTVIAPIYNSGNLIHEYYLNNPLSIGAKETIKTTYLDAINYIYSMNDLDYKLYCKKTREKTEEIYSINKVVKQLNYFLGDV